MKWITCTEYGTNRLLKQGANLVLNAKDIIDFIPNGEYKEIEHKKINEKLINPRYLKIYKLILDKKLDCNQISRNLNKSISEVNSVLFMMELEGLIKKLPNGEYVIKGD